MCIHENIGSLIRELLEYVELEGTEVGEVCQKLIYLVDCFDYVSDKFYTALYIEINKQLEYFKNNTRIVENEIIQTYKVKELERKGIDY